MRTLTRIGVLCVIVAGTAGTTTGCDDVTAGQPTDSSAPPQLVHALVQDARWLVAYPNRGSSLDILDNNATRACTISCKGNCPANPTTKQAPAQLDTCINEFLVDQVAPDVHCLDTNVCSDPLKIPTSGVPVPGSHTLIGLAPSLNDPGGGVQVRLVFDKVLDNSIESITPSGSTTPGATNSYTIVPGLVDLVDDAGKSVKSVMYYDNGGSSQFSADLELVPLGPAIVIKPTAPLDAATTYTVKILNPGAIKDREGNAAVALGGGALPASLGFKTEDLTPTNAGAFPSDAAGGNGFDFPDFTASTVNVTPNEVLQLGFFEAFAGDSATVTVKSGCAGAKPIAYSERGNDATMCTKQDPGGYPVLDVVNSDSGNVASGMPVD
ncbi:MAG TPA: Ig-like domain-containing protein, partial [Polyangia bacterium]